MSTSSTDSNGKVSLREFLELRFDAIEMKLDAMCKTADDHETRLRAVENRTTWSRVFEGTLGLISAVLIALGFKQP